jgi:hypothetical protein
MQMSEKQKVLHLKSKLNARYTSSMVQHSFGTLNGLVAFCTTLENNLNDQYGEHDAENRHFTAMAQLTQGQGEDFTTFYTKYQAHAPYMQMSEKQKVLHLKSKLNARYTSSMVQHSFGTLNGLVAFCTTLENNLNDLEARHPRKEKTFATTAAKGISASASIEHKPHSDRFLPDAWKKKDPVPEKYRKLSWPCDQLEYERLVAENRCTKCHDKGHKANERDTCPLGRWSPGALNAAKAGNWAFTKTTNSSAATLEAGKEQANS